MVNSTMLVNPVALFQEICSPPFPFVIATCKSEMSIKTKLADVGGKLDDSTGNVLSGEAKKFTKTRFVGDGAGLLVQFLKPLKIFSTFVPAMTWPKTTKKLFVSGASSEELFVRLKNHCEVAELVSPATFAIAIVP